MPNGNQLHTEWDAAWLERHLPRTQNRDGDHRNPFQRDKARVLHSAAFRRLQAKTQVLGVGISDFYRTRLTHSLEAAQIGTGIAAQLLQKFPQETERLKLDSNLIETLCLAHDIGHPPFGHGGEIALHFMMQEYGGFEGNGQTFRIVTRLEPYTQHHGMNLCRRSILGLIKYPNFIDALTHHQSAARPASLRKVKAEHGLPPKGLYRCDEPLFNWLLEPLSDADKTTFMSVTESEDSHHKTRFKSFDCSIMELADDIAYGIHDLEDAIAMQMITHADFIAGVADPVKALALPWLSSEIHALSAKLFSAYQYERKNAIGALVNYFITAISIHHNEQFEHPLLAYNAHLPETYLRALSQFKRFVFDKVIRKPEVQLLEYKGQQIVMELFEAFASDPERLLPENTRVHWREADAEDNGQRVIADYISGMTDEFAARLYATMFIPKHGSGKEVLTP
ncbi:anti-phage deoxyguanosine triphosphatase [Alteromonas ponticola]|uniref:Deoxyguanosinetriphosphate triphosphohydrolase-like protein n=1 Tax=Alteromonas ponticola TaxID=2720613 RepID=A0ABX1QY81_9ALTE|nr:anti-phage deoxyguanosine triphosphatase [Alteromonas ponticola]NMH58661.1 deoxyguanosinetriphosphate triphosphohydrolase family protein [Alteromonas ponticola]